MNKAVLCFAMSGALALNAATSFAADAPPKNQVHLGAASYKTMPVYQLEKPVVFYMDEEFLLSKGLGREEALEKLAFASPVDGEDGAAYKKVSKTAYVDGNGGIGLNNNFGSGRAATIEEEWQLKGSGKTMMVNPATDDGHRNGASVLAEGIHEAVWSNLLAGELPYGAFRVVAVIGTGSTVNSGGHRDQPRVIIVREDPLRPGHYVINTSAEELNDPWDKARVAEAMSRLVDALPQPKGASPRNRTEKFRSGVFEFIDRQAVQHSYAWAHSMFHGGTSPTNAGLDGRALDFGTYSAFDGYPKARILSDDGFMGETEVYKRDLLKDIRDSWVKTLPKDLLAALPTEQEWFGRFESSFEKTRRTEMLRLAGVFTEFAPVLLKTPEGEGLAKTLLRIAEAGNENRIEIWKGENPFGRGRYNLGRILTTLSEMDPQAFDPNAEALRTLLPETALRRVLADQYLRVVHVQRALAAREGISAAAESEYRRLASEIRNRKMTGLFRVVDNEKNIWKITDDFKATGNAKAAQEYIDRKISENRRDFHDAKPFTLVLGEVKKNGKTERQVFDARKNRILKTQSLWKRAAPVAGGRCEMIWM